MTIKKSKKVNTLLSGLLPAAMAKAYLFSNSKPKFKNFKLR